MFEDYKKLVVAHYRKRLADADLSNDLAAPTTGKIKRECLKAYTQRLNSGDKPFINDFFGLDENGTGHAKIINGTDADRFRPLLYFLRGTTTDPDDIHIELLAWLTDYQPRPFRFDTFQPPAVPTQPEPPVIPGSLPPPLPPISTPPTNTRKERWHKNRYVRWSGIAFAGALATIGISYLLGFNDDGHFASKQCMVWSIDHYEATSCDQKIFGKQIIALDTFQLAHFRLITKPDTLTAYSVDKVWYVKINSLPEYFTGPGKHPLYPYKNLRPLSILILRKYSAVK
ncbi:hypothetical protein DHW03_01570 [Pedobacter yonginense]|uniref:Uncharacterized protein n=1 Tax=Pedobacter yonginense TaxID=651869 RepID=A0A317ERT5_9SPHI|nr:hypothetical protein [Pedobacter yonginense]PWS28569.1 hypothetical protein DHW03_01570 [Pedobacter yonginense]